MVRRMVATTFMVMGIVCGIRAAQANSPIVVDNAGRAIGHFLGTSCGNNSPSILVLK
jgi:hypothetical protein